MGMEVVALLLGCLRVVETNQSQRTHLFAWGMCLQSHLSHWIRAGVVVLIPSWLEWRDMID